MPWIWLALGCTVLQTEAQLVEATCADTGCPVCERDADCVVAHNPCSDVAVCAHADQAIAVISIGCSKAIEHGTPPDSACVCAETTCAPK